MKKPNQLKTRVINKAIIFVFFVLVSSASSPVKSVANTNMRIYSFEHTKTANYLPVKACYMPPAASWLTGWQYRKKITVDQTKVDADLTDFPVRVSLTSSNFNFSKARSDGYDIRFTSSDGTTILKYERERHDQTNSLAEYWVKVTSVSGTVDTDIYMYFGKSDAADGADAVNVWDANYVMIQHLNDASTSIISDATSYSNNGTKKGANEPFEADGKIGKGQHFDGTDDYINCGSASSLGMTEIVTLEAWIKVDAHIVSNANEGLIGRDWQFQITMDSRETNKYTNFFINTTSTQYIRSSTAFLAETWVYIAGTYDKNAGSNNLNIYVNDGSAQSLTKTSTANPTSVMFLGKLVTDGLQYLDGMIDEARVSKVARSAAWIKASYYSGNNSLMTYGNEETINNIAQCLTGWEYRKKITVDQTKVDADLTDFPILISLKSSNFNFSKARSDGYDIRFTSSDGSTLLKYERERHDQTNSLAEYWVKVPSVSGTVNTDIYMYYGNSGAADGADAVNVWDSNFKMVQHLNDGTTSTIVDATSNNNNGAKKGAGEPAQADEKIAKGQSFDEYDDIINIGDISMNNITVEAWAKCQITSNGNEPIVNKGYTSHNPPYYEYGLYLAQTTGYVGAWLTVGGTGYGIEGATTFGNNAWHYLVMRYDGETLSVSGDAGTESQDASPSGNITDYATNAIIGGFTNVTTPGAYLHFNNSMDEIRISNIARSTAWIKATYNSENNTLLTYGNEEYNITSWLTGWQYRKKFTIDQSKVDADLTNFPGLVSLTSSNFNFSKARSDGYDIRFTTCDGTTLLKYDRERHDATGQKAEYWVKVPYVSGTFDTDIYMYYGKTNATDGEDHENVWDSNFKMVQHLKDNTTSTISDVTSNHNNGTKKVANEPLEAEGKIAKGQSFAGTDDYISVGDVSQSYITLEAWVKTPGIVDQNSWIINKGYTSHSNPYYEYGLIIGRTNAGGGASTNIVVNGTLQGVGDANTWSDNAWHYIVGRFDGSAMKVKGDMSADANINVSGTINHYITNAIIGGPTNSAAAGFFVGIIDELRISNVARSDAWVKASYYSGNNSLFTSGNEEFFNNTMNFGTNF
ncbi:MAG: DUF2341 domain-containing protein [Bacteroidetes bacterium]|nr:DUF2341 domain-containing protein [Bacteroidota bacterium]